MTTEKVVLNYTESQTAEMIEKYLAGWTVENIAESVGKSARSVIAKLSREKVYVAKVRTVGAAVTKATLVAQIEGFAQASEGTFKSLEKADKQALEALVALLTK
jgi:hypothetical protein